MSDRFVETVRLATYDAASNDILAMTFVKTELLTLVAYSSGGCIPGGKTFHSR